MQTDGELAATVEAFFGVLSEDGAGRAMLGEIHECYHFELGPHAGLLLTVTEGRVAVTPLSPDSLPPRPDVTRLACEARTLRALAEGRLAFWEGVVPMSTEHGAILFVDNWMAKKGTINQLGRLCRLARERHGHLGDAR